MLKTLKQNSKRLFYKHKVVTRVTSMLLVFTLLFTSLPLGGMVASAAEVNDENTIITVEKELTEYRTEYSKTYLMSNNTLESVISANPMHYKNDSDSWVDIDSTLVLEETEDGEVYKNKAGGYAVSFPATNENGSSVKIESGEHTIEIELVEGKKSHARKDTSNKNKAKKLTKEQRKLMTASELYAVDSNQNSALEYNDIYENTNVRYDINPTSVKESVIITKAPNKKVSYSYNIKADGLVAQLNENDSISFYEKTDTKKQNAVFVMPAPLMYDANDIYCYDIETTLKQKKGVYVLTYKPDYNWLKAKDRAYPVVLDPTTYVANSTQDAYTYSADEYQNRNIGSENQIKVGRSTWKDPNGDTFETFIRFDELPTIPDGYVINSALLMLTTKAYHGTWQELEVGAHKITEDWTNKLNQPLPLINYLNQPDAESFPRATAHIVRGEVDTEVGFEISALVNEWYEDPTTNYGVKLSLAEPPPTDADNVLFHSSRATNGIPYLSITCEEYIPVTDIEITEKCDELELTNLSNSFDVAATVYPENATNKEVIWEVEDENIAYYNNGQIYGVNIGTTTVTAKSADNGEIFDSFELEVFTIPIESIQITNCPTDFLDVGQTHSFGFVLNPDNASHLIDPSLASWSSSNPAVAEIDYYGNVTAYSAGQTTISVCYGDFVDSYVLTVMDVYITQVTSNITNNFKMSAQQTVRMNLFIEPNNVTDKRAIATSSNENVLTITSYTDSNNKQATPYFDLTAVSDGTAIIYVEFPGNPGMNFTTTVIVGSGDLQLSLPKHNRIKEGNTWKLTSNPMATVTIEDKNILSTDGNGNITALSVGTTAVEVSLNDGINWARFDITVFCGLTIINRPKYVIRDENNEIEDIVCDHIYVNEIYTSLELTGGPENPNEVVWSSSNPQIASVIYDIELGKVILTGLSPGTTEISGCVTDSSNTVVDVDTFEVTVDLNPVERVEVSIDGDDLELYSKEVFPGEEVIVRAIVFPESAANAYDRIEWFAEEIGDNDYASVKIIACSNWAKIIPLSPGYVCVYPKINGIAPVAWRANITVKDNPVEFAYDTPESLFRGQTYTLSASAEYEKSVFTYISNKSSVISVDKNTGVITAKNAGVATITVIADCNGYKTTKDVTITVKQPHSTITVPANGIIQTGTTYQLKYDIVPDGAEVTWDTSNINVATVSKTGLITAKSNGEVTITLKYGFGEVYLTHSIDLLISNVVIKNVPSNRTVFVDGNLDLNAVVYVNGTTSTNIIWSIVGSTTSASINENGVITGNANGIVTVKAAYEDNTTNYSYTTIEVKKTKSYWYYLKEPDENGISSRLTIANAEKTLIAEKYYGGHEEYVQLIELTSGTQFANSWNNLGKNGYGIGFVTIHCHGDYSGLWEMPNANDSEVEVSEILNLEHKSMEGLVMISCDVGNLNHVDKDSDNVASAFAKIVNGAPVIAAEGEVWHNESAPEGVYYAWIEENAAKGWMIYKYIGYNNQGTVLKIYNTNQKTHKVNNETHAKYFAIEELFKEVVSYPSRTIYRRIVYDN